MSDLVYLVGLFVQQLIATFFMYSLGEPKRAFMKCVVRWYIPMALLYCVFTFLIPKTPDIVEAISRALILLSFVLFMFGGSLKKRLFQYFSFYIISFVLEFSAFLLTKLIFNNVPEFAYLAGSDDTAIAYMRVVFTDYMFLGFINVIVVAKRKELKESGMINDIHLLGLFVLLHFVFMVFHTKLDGELTDEENLLQQSFQMLLFTLVLLYYFSSIKRRELMKAEQELIQLRTAMELEQNYYALANDKYDKISKVRHDIENQLSTVLTLMDRQDGSEEAQEIIESLRKKLAGVKGVNYCDEPTVNALMSLKLADKRLTDIEVSTDLRGCGESGLEPSDLCSLFANIFDNAVEACMKFSDKSGCFISVKSGIKNGMFVLRCENSCCGPFEQSSKKGSGHGYGLRIVSEICERHGGELTINSKDDIVKVTAVAEIKEQG